jgi:hypothetical protein
MPEGSGLPSSAVKTGSQAVDTRQEQRLHIAVPVKVFPDIRSAEWQTCCTYEISMIGARLASMSAINKVGQVIWIQRLNRRAKYKVIWIGQSGTSQAGQVGVESMEPGNVIWESEIKARIMSSR